MKRIVTKQKDDLVTLILPCSFDVSYYEEFKAICESFKADDNRFELDFSETQYMDSSALGMLLLLREQVKGDKNRLQLINAGGTALKILEIAQFNQLFNFK
ncbi:MAG: STAS domain-containing protein [Thiomicrorhabdus sp.]|nr:STAS domain-containing protein [Thiomicrorhabdus sp.]